MLFFRRRKKKKKSEEEEEEEEDDSSSSEEESEEEEEEEEQGVSRPRFIAEDDSDRAVGEGDDDYEEEELSPIPEDEETDDDDDEPNQQQPSTPSPSSTVRHGVAAVAPQEPFQQQRHVPADVQSVPPQAQALPPIPASPARTSNTLQQKAPRSPHHHHHPTSHSTPSKKSHHPRKESNSASSTTTGGPSQQEKLYPIMEQLVRTILKSEAQSERETDKLRSQQQQNNNGSLTFSSHLSVASSSETEDVGGGSGHGGKYQYYASDAATVTTCNSAATHGTAATTGTALGDDDPITRSHCFKALKRFALNQVELKRLRKQVHEQRMYEYDHERERSDAILSLQEMQSKSLCSGALLEKDNCSTVATSTTKSMTTANTSSYPSTTQQRGAAVPATTTTTTTGVETLRTSPWKSAWPPIEELQQDVYLQYLKNKVEALRKQNQARITTAMTTTTAAAAVSPANDATAATGGGSRLEQLRAKRRAKEQELRDQFGVCAHDLISVDSGVSVGSSDGSCGSCDEDEDDDHVATDDNHAIGRYAGPEPVVHDDDDESTTCYSSARDNHAVQFFHVCGSTNGNSGRGMMNDHSSSSMGSSLPSDPSSSAFFSAAGSERDLRGITAPMPSLQDQLRNNRAVVEVPVLVQHDSYDDSSEEDDDDDEDVQVYHNRYSTNEPPLLVRVLRHKLDETQGRLDASEERAARLQEQLAMLTQSLGLAEQMAQELNACILAQHRQYVGGGDAPGDADAGMIVDHEQLVPPPLRMVASADSDCEDEDDDEIEDMVYEPVIRTDKFRSLSPPTAPPPPKDPDVSENTGCDSRSSKCSGSSGSSRNRRGLWNRLWNGRRSSRQSEVAQ